MYEHRQRGYRLIPVGIPHMHYGRLGDTPIGFHDTRAYNPGSNGERASWTREGGSGQSPTATADRNALLTRSEGGLVL